MQHSSDHLGAVLADLASLYRDHLGRWRAADREVLTRPPEQPRPSEQPAA